MSELLVLSVADIAARIEHLALLSKSTADNANYFIPDPMLTIADADVLVRALNSHDELLAALKVMDARFRLALSKAQYYPELVDENALDQAFAAIRKAEGQ